MSNKITTGDIKTVGKVANMSGMFVPNDDQKRLKATFWRRWNAGPVRSDDEISAAAITEITDTSVVEKWWKDDKFKSWFKNQDTFSEDADYNANIAIETLRQLMFCDNPSIRLKAASESLKLKSELDKKAIDAENNTDMDAEQMQKLFLKALNAGLISLPGVDNE